MNVYQKISLGDLVQTFAKPVGIDLPGEEGGVYENALFVYLFTTDGLIKFVDEIVKRIEEPNETT
jgi:hypothetical protein